MQVMMNAPKCTERENMSNAQRELTDLYIKHAEAGAPKPEASLFRLGCWIGRGLDEILLEVLLS